MTVIEVRILETVTVPSDPLSVVILDVGLPGPAGAAGAAGSDGQGLPTGGTTGQVATKASNADFDIVWSTPSGGGGGGASNVIQDLVATGNINSGTDVAYFTGGSAAILTLPAGTEGKNLIVKKTGAGALTLACSGADTIEGSASIDMAGIQSRSLQFHLSKWNIL